MMLLSLAIALAPGTSLPQEGGCATPQTSCSGQDAALTPGSARITSDAGVARIPFELRDNHVILSAQVDGREGIDLILDTGMPTPGIVLFSTPAVQALELRSSGQVLVGGVGSGAAVPSGLIRGVELSLPGLELSGVTALALASSSCGAPDGESASDPFSADGIIGYELLAPFVVQLDFEERVAVVTEPGAFTPPPRSSRLPITLRNGYPLVDLSFVLPDGKARSSTFVLDLGASHVASFDVEDHDDFAVPGSSLPYLGRGIQGPVRARAGRIPSLTMGGFVLEEPIVNFNERGRLCSSFEKVANLGTGALKRFDVVLDYPGLGLYLAPNSGFDAPFEADMTGALLERLPDGTLRIVEVVPSSPAGEAGLLPGTIVLEIDGRPVAEHARSALQALLQRPGETVLLGIEVGGEPAEVRLALRRLI